MYKIFFGRIIQVKLGKIEGDAFINYKIIEDGEVKDRVCLIKGINTSRQLLFKQVKLYQNFFKNISIRNDESLLCFFIKTTDDIDYLWNIISNHSFKELESSIDSIAKIDFQFINARQIARENTQLI
jgi:hypothetical protein